ncbi:MAG: VPLPA-CTERM sorting domain-containing protein [Planctomycetota bacterium]
MLQFLFDEPITGFGIDIIGWGNWRYGELTAMNNGTVTDPFQIAEVSPDNFTPLLPNGERFFFGVVDEQPFDLVTFHTTAYGDEVGFDDMAFGNARIIPLPAASLAGITGFVALGVIRHRRRS